MYSNVFTSPLWREDIMARMNHFSFTWFLGKSAAVSFKCWVQEEIARLKRRKCLPCFASIIQQANFPLGNRASSETFKWIKSWASVSHTCLFRNNFWNSPTHLNPHYAHSLKWYMDQQEWQLGFSNCIVFFTWCIHNETVVHLCAYVCLCMFVGVTLRAHKSEWKCVWAAGRLRRCYR